MPVSKEINATIHKKNARIIVEALHFFKQPQTIACICKYIAKGDKVNAIDIRLPVQSTLKRGVKYGFIRMNKSCYGIPRNIRKKRISFMSLYGSKTKSKRSTKSGTEAKKSTRGRKRTISQNKSNTKARGKSMPGRSSSRAKRQNTMSKRGSGSTKGRK